MKHPDKSVRVNGAPVNAKTYHKATRYITQDDELPQLLTTRETMSIAANLKLPTIITNKQKQILIEEILHMLRLEDCNDTRTENLSGGQKKRLSIAYEMINNPSVFFLDEPTSGLDNVATAQCLKILRELARQGRTIICTIHQPSASLFATFDHVYVLGRGKCIYQGSSQQLVPFLSSVGFMCPINYNPADYVIELIDGENENIETLSKATQNGKLSLKDSEKLCEKISSLKQQKVCEKCSKDLSDDNFVCNCATNTSNLSLTDSSVYVDCDNNTVHQFYILICRMFLQSSRNKLALYIQTIHYLSCALILGFVFYNTANDGYQWMVHLKFCLCYVLFHCYTNVMIPLLRFPPEIRLLRKEYFNGWYNLPPYFAAQILSNMPAQVLFGTTFSAIVYYMNGLPNDFVRFAHFTLTGLFVTFVADSIGLAIGSIFSITNGAAVGPLLNAPFLGLAVYGFDFARDIPWITYALMQLSYIRNGVVATSLTLFGFDRKILDCPDVYCHFQDPQTVLHFVYLESTSIWQEYGSMFLIYLFFRIISYFALKKRLYVK